MVSLAGLALTAGAQTTKSNKPVTAKHASHGKVNAGEAASLERTEAGQASEDVREDNRGRLTSARLSNHPKQVSNAVYHGPSKTVAAAKQKDVHHQGHTAQLKTGQLTSRQSTHLQTKKTALHGSTHSGSTHSNQRLPAEQTASPQDKGTPEIHLKKHNARMF